MFIFFSGAFGAKLGLALGLAWLGQKKVRRLGRHMFIFFSGAFGAKLGSAWLLAWLSLVKKVFVCRRQTRLALAWLGLGEKNQPLRRYMFNFFLWRLRRQTWLGLLVGLA